MILRGSFRSRVTSSKHVAPGLPGWRVFLLREGSGEGEPLRATAVSTGGLTPRRSPADALLPGGSGPGRAAVALDCGQQLLRQVHLLKPVAAAIAAGGAAGELVEVPQVHEDPAAAHREAGVEHGFN